MYMLPTVIFGFVTLSFLFAFAIYQIGAFALKSNSPVLSFSMNLFRNSKTKTNRSISGMNRKKRCMGGLNAIDALIIFAFYYIILRKYSHDFFIITI